MENIGIKKRIILFMAMSFLLYSLWEFMEYSAAENVSDNQTNIIKVTEMDEDRELGDLLFSGAEISYADGISTFSCYATNFGSEPVYGTYQIHLYDINGNLVISLLAYIGESLPSQETRKITSSATMNFVDMVTNWSVSHSMADDTEIESVKEVRMVDDIFLMEDTHVYPVNDKYWAFECTLKQILRTDVTLPQSFLVNFVFLDENNKVLYNIKVLEQITLSDKKRFYALYTKEDLSSLKFISVDAEVQISEKEQPTNVPTRVPTIEPTMTTEPTATPTLMPTEAPVVPTEKPTEKPTGVPSPMPTDNKNLILEEKEAGVSVFQLKGKDNKVTLSWNNISPKEKCIIYRSTKKNGTYKKIATVKGKKKYTDRKLKWNRKYFYKIQITNQKISQIKKWVVPAIKTPKINVKVKQYPDGFRYARIKVKNLAGRYIEISYRKGKKFKVVKLKDNKISKKKNTFNIGYKNTKKKLYFRVRTFKKKKNKLVYSLYSNIVCVKNGKKN